MQADRDAVDTFSAVTRKELRDLELSVIDKQRELEETKDAHRLEVKVYTQKARHIEYEHSSAVTAARGSGDTEREAEDRLHLLREGLLREQKQGIRASLRATEGANADTLNTLAMMQDRNAAKMKQEFAASLAALRARYEARLEALRRDSALRHSVEVHEVEERKNSHINQLLRAHESAFSEMKTYYNDITKANLGMVTSLKGSISEAGDKQAANQRLMLEIAEENMRLSDPFARAQAELASLQSDLRDADKDRQSLAYARMRLAALKRQLAATQTSHAALEAAYASAQAERDELYGKFEGTVSAAAERSASRAGALEERLAEAEAAFLSKRAVVGEVLAAARLDPSVLATVGTRLDAVLEERNAAIRHLRAGLATLKKGTNDAVRVFEARLAKLGVHVGEAKEGRETVVPLYPAGSMGPAGLVATSRFG